MSVRAIQNGLSGFLKKQNKTKQNTMVLWRVVRKVEWIWGKGMGEYNQNILYKVFKDV